MTIQLYVTKCWHTLFPLPLSALPIFSVASPIGGDAGAGATVTLTIFQFPTGSPAIGLPNTLPGEVIPIVVSDVLSGAASTATSILSKGSNVLSAAVSGATGLANPSVISSVVQDATGIIRDPLGPSGVATSVAGGTTAIPVDVVVTAILGCLGQASNSLDSVLRWLAPTQLRQQPVERYKRFVWVSRAANLPVKRNELSITECLEGSVEARDVELRTGKKNQLGRNPFRVPTVQVTVLGYFGLLGDNPLPQT
ncbi:hypothetical protein C8R43DRAFT_964040 [Mycena crocata]|nr:hypothetical protein C8R43DRAFT_964040 [Mycena crocata]